MSGTGAEPRTIEISGGMSGHPCLDPATRRAVARLYWQAFGGKLGRVLGPSERGIAFVERVLSPEHGLFATDEAGRLCGIIGYRTGSGSFVGGGMADLRAVYGHTGGRWRAFALGLLADDLPPRTLAVDGLVVDAELRGQGIGRTLLEGLISEARRQGYHVLRLEVVGGNHRARKLYERIGFQVVRRVKSPLTAVLFGFHARDAMEYALCGSVEDL